MEDSRGLLFVVVLILFILLSPMFFRGNPLEDEETCARYAFNAGDC